MEHLTIEQIATEYVPNSWVKLFENAKLELKSISNTLEKQEQLNGKIYPLKQDIFRAFHLTKLEEVKVVLIGQDPYPQTIIFDGKPIPRATGLSFSVNAFDEIPSSLKNIYKELERSINGFKAPNHGDLSQWAQQGILMLNMCLTIRPGQPQSHGEIWLQFINKVCKAIAEVNPKCIYVLWGKEAQKIGRLAGEKSIILDAPHPSGLSAYRGFIGCNHFNKINEILISQGKRPIDWSINSL